MFWLFYLNKKRHLEPNFQLKMGAAEVSALCRPCFMQFASKQIIILPN